MNSLLMSRKTILLLFMVIAAFSMSCDGDSGDTVKKYYSDDDDDDCIICAGTEECLDTLGLSWVCVDGCCEELGDDDDSSDDDDDDDTEDDDDDTGDDDDDATDDDDDATDDDDDDTTDDDDDTSDDDDDDTADDDDDDTADDDDDDTADDDDDDTADDDDDDTADDDDDDVADDDDDDTIDVFWSENFDAMPLGPLPTPPWYIWESNATIMVVAAKAGSGNVVEIVDPSQSMGNGAAAGILLDAHPEIAGQFYLDYDILNISSNGALLAALSHDAYGVTYHQFYIIVSATVIEGVGWISGVTTYVTCKVATNFHWQKITLDIDPVGELYTVYIDDAPSFCNDIPFLNPGIPLDGFSWFGDGAIGINGDYRFDNIVAYTIP